jgi:acetyl coenzyme A synthetase (ADP forming)-like protein
MTFDESAAPSGALDAILKPRTIAVVGASRTPNTIGHQIVANLVGNGFTGAVYPVNPKARAIHAMRAWPSVASIPEPVDVAVITVPKERVGDVAEECGAAGVRGLVVISAGFREVGGDGPAREQQLLEVVRRHGMRMLGPNCMGAINTAEAYRMNATFSPVTPPFGTAAFVSQSGALGVNVLDYARELGIGIAQFVSMGNKSDISGNDLLLQWEHDPDVGVILMYAENFGNPRRFLEIASRVVRTKPIIVLKAGRSDVGARAASSHTGALAASDTAVDALLTQAGVLRAASIEELFDLAMAFTAAGRVRIPRGRRVAIVTNSGGPGVLAADALEMAGMDVVELQEGTVAALRPLFPAEASIRNPLDMIASANPPGYRTALGAMLDASNVDAAVAIFTPPLGVRIPDVAEAIGATALEHATKPVLAVLMGREGLPQGKAELQRAGVPAYIFPESAARALRGVVRYGEIAARPPREVPQLQVKRDAVRAIIERARADGATKLTELDAIGVIEAYGIPVAGARLAATADEAVAHAAALRYPVVLKVVSPQVIHKSDVGGVRVGLRDAAEVREAHAAIVESVARAVPGAEISGVLVQRMAGTGRELIAGITRVPDFGAMILVGLGGVYVEAIRDVQLRMAPIDARDAEEMLRTLRASAILGPMRGEPAVDVARVAEVLVRLGMLAADFPDIEELDVNPLRVSEAGGLALDARVLLAPTHTPTAPGTPRTA